jgi:GT2 family glycosyltransferase
MNTNLTVIIVVYKTKKNLLKNFISQIDESYKILIIDNSYFYDFADIENLKNVSIFRSKENTGNGGGINIGLTRVDTPYAIYFDIDTFFKKNFLKEMEKCILEIKNFCILIPNINSQYNSENDFIELYDGEGAVMLFNVNEVIKIGLFDTTYFMCYEESDLFLRCKKYDKKIFILPKIHIKHDGSTSIEGDGANLDIIGVRSWHIAWSYFYFLKKNYSYFFAIKKTYLSLFKNFLKLFFFIYKNDKKNICIRYNRVLGLINSMLLLKSSKRPKLD